MAARPFRAARPRIEDLIDRTVEPTYDESDSHEDDMVETDDDPGEDPQVEEEEEEEEEEQEQSHRERRDHMPRTSRSVDTTHIHTFQGKDNTVACISASTWQKTG